MAQNIAVLLQLPLTEQQSPNVLVKDMAPTVDEDPHFSSSETGVHDIISSSVSDTSIGVIFQRQGSR